MSVPAVDHIYGVILKYRGEGSTHVDFRLLQVGIVIFALGVGGVMEDDNGPVEGVLTQVIHQPVAHGRPLLRVPVG